MKEDTLSSVRRQTMTDDNNLTNRLVILLGLLALSRVGVYVPVSPQIDTVAVSEVLMRGGGLTSYVDALTGGSIEKAGLFALGIVPFVNASIIMQLMTSVFPRLKRLSRDEGAAGRRKFSQYRKVIAFFFALVQAFAQLFYLRPYVADYSPYWLFENSIVLATGAIILTFFADEIDKLKLGNGTSILIFTNILSSVPISRAANTKNLYSGDIIAFVTFLGVFLFTILGIVYVQEAERKIPINYAARYAWANDDRTSYLPLKVNATGVMPIIFASSFLALPGTLSRFSDNEIIKDIASAINPKSPFYTCFSIALIFLFNYLYTLLQFDPKEVAENLKKSGASISAIRPGKATSDYLERVLVYMSVLGSGFLGFLALAPSSFEESTGILIFSGLGSSSILILVGVATDFARRLRAEKLMLGFKQRDDLVL